MSRRAQINLRLAAAGNSLQQKRLRTLRIYRLINLCRSILLLRRQLQAFATLLHRVVAVAQHTLLHCVRQTVLRQCARHSGAHALLRQLAHAQRPCSLRQYAQRSMLPFGAFGKCSFSQRLPACGIDAVGQHSFFLQTLIINIIKQTSLRITHGTPLNARFSRHEKAHRLCQRTHIIICHPFSSSQHFLIKPWSVPQGCLHRLQLTSQHFITRQRHTLYHKALHLLAAEGNNYTPAAVYKLQCFRHTVGKLTE